MLKGAWLLLRRGLDDTSGATAIEYGLLVSLLALGIVGGAMATGESLGALISQTMDQISVAFSGS